MKTRNIVVVSTAWLALAWMAPAQETPVSYRLADRNGRTVIEASTGDVVPWSSYSLGPDVSLDDWQEKQDALIEAGVRLFQVPLFSQGGGLWAQPFFSMDGEPVAEPRMAISWTNQVPRLIEKCPDARVMMRFGLETDQEWRKANREHFHIFTPGLVGTPPHEFAVLPSLASDLCLERTERLIRDMVAWCEKQPWRDRIVGYSIFTYGEGATEAALFGDLFDTSEVMQSAFRAWVRKRYETDEALREAWGDDSVSLETATVPVLAEWREKQKEQAMMHWPEPAKVRKERDYFLLQKELFHRYWSRVFSVLQEATVDRPVIKGYDTLKQHMQGWMHNAAFSAAWEPGMQDRSVQILFASGSSGAAPLLDHPGLDVLQTPGMYYNRAVGYAWEAEGLGDSLSLRGKLNFMEADMRTWVRKAWRGVPFKEGQLIADAGVFMNPSEMNAGFDRTLAWALSRNQMFYYASVCGANWWYHDPAITETIGRQVNVVSSGLPWSNTTDAICLVVDDEAGLYEDFSNGFQNLAVYRQIEEGLALAGVPYRIHLLSDLQMDNFPDYKCYLFPNLYKVDADTEDLLRKKVLRKGHLAVFGPGTGITDGEQLSADGATRLLGVPMELVSKSCGRRVILQDHGHPLSRGLSARTYGDSYAYGPLLVAQGQRLPAEGTAWAIGAGFYFYFFDRPGPFVNDVGRGAAGSGQDGARDAGDYSVVFSPAVPLPPELLRACARYAGCHVWLEENAVVYASDGFVAVHLVRGGEHVLRFPEPADVWDLATNEKISSGSDRITFTVEAPATRLFRYTPIGK